MKKKAWTTYHGFEGDVAIFLESRFALFLGGGSVVCDVSHVTLFLKAVVTLDFPVIHRLFNLKKKTVENQKNGFVSNCGVCNRVYGKKHTSHSAKPHWVTFELVQELRTVFQSPDCLNRKKENE